MPSLYKATARNIFYSRPVSDSFLSGTEWETINTAYIIYKNYIINEALKVSTGIIWRRIEINGELFFTRKCRFDCHKKHEILPFASICFSRCLCCSCYMCVRQAVLFPTGLPDKNMSHCVTGVHVADAYKGKLLPYCPCKSR
jgi:hypothetical protein